MSPNIGIIACELYFPKNFIHQTVIEEIDGCPGKYTKGLGQQTMGVCDEAEDVNSMALTVTKHLIDRLGLDLKTVGFLEVGSESLVDKSKATKTVLMSLFEESGNFDVAGIDVKSACYGSTAAFFNAINWLESSSCDGRLALVVASDVAVYATKSTQPTGGAGAVALLLGPNAPIVVDPGLRVCSMRHRYDFYKPTMKSIFPEVDGQLSVSCYKEALLTCYSLYSARVKKLTGHDVSVIADASADFPVDFACFHSPFCRLVAKSFAWLALQDAKRFVASPSSSVPPNAAAPTNGDAADLADSRLQTIVAQLSPVLEAADSPEVSREVDGVCLAATQPLFAAKVKPSLRVASHVGNMYTASLYSCLVSLCCLVPEVDLRGRRILMFAYGSGYTASMFSLHVGETADLRAVFGEPSALLDRLSQRTAISHPHFLETIRLRQEQLDQAPVTMPSADLEKRFFPGTFYLTHIDEKHRRFYERTLAQ